MIAVGWCRVSTREQAGPEHYSLEAQAAAIRRYCADRGWVVADMLDYVGSGGHHAEALAALRGRLEAVQADVLVVAELDRLGRDLVLVLGFLEDLTRAGYRFASVSEPDLDLTTPDGELRLAILGTFAQYFRRQLSRKVRAGLLQRWRAGRRNGGQAPYGYAAGPDGRWAIVPDEAAVVRRIFAEYAAGAGYRRITRDLNGDGIPTKTGRTWNSTTVSRMLSNPVYVGDLRFGARRVLKDRQGRYHVEHRTPSVAADTHPAIIDRDLWEVVQARRAQRRVLGLQGRPTPTVLSGFLRCGDCGGPMRYTRYPHAARRPRWDCRHRVDQGTCRGPSIAADTAEAQVRQALRDEAQAIERGDPEALARWAQDHAAVRAWVARQARREIVLADRATRLARAEEAYLAGVMTLAEYEAVKTRLAAATDPEPFPGWPDVQAAAAAACRAALDWRDIEATRSRLRRAGLLGTVRAGRVDVTWAALVVGEPGAAADPGPHMEIPLGGAEAGMA